MCSIVFELITLVLYLSFQIKLEAKMMKFNGENTDVAKDIPAPFQYGKHDQQNSEDLGARSSPRND